jgi:hypothetical protein
MLLFTQAFAATGGVFPRSDDMTENDAIGVSLNDVDFEIKAGGVISLSCTCSDSYGINGLIVLCSIV